MKLDSVIFCEDIRNEINNKHTLVGIYTDRIILQADKPVEAVKFPALSRLSCYFRFLKEDSDSSVDTFEIKFMLPVPGVELPVVSGALKINLDYKYFTITIVGESIPVQPGNIGYRLTLKSGDTVVREFLDEKALAVIYQDISKK